MVSQVSTPAAFLDEDLRELFRVNLVETEISERCLCLRSIFAVKNSINKHFN